MANTEIINNYYNHVDTSEINYRLKKIYQAVKEDTAIEQFLVKQNEELRKELEDLLTGETLPPAVQAKIENAVSKIKANTDRLKQGVQDNQQ